ncbi:MAG: hypothetical protein HQM11_10390 [SAR324 cluster bacterium]|nr:hypothetical protein [SAR324 cluster bacterium]
MKIMGITGCLVLSMYLSAGTSAAWAGRIDSGLWKQTSSTAGECLECQLTITEETPHTLKMVANNGWIGYVYYVPVKDEYHGFFELQKGASLPGASNWKNKVFTLKAYHDLVTLTIEAQSEKIRFKATFRKVPQGVL